MNTQERGLGRLLIVALPLIAVGICTSSSKPATSAGARTMKISISRSLFRDIPEAAVLHSMEPLGQILSRATGMTSSLVVAADGAELAGKLDAGAIDVGVFDGVEFAWAQQHNKRLQAVMITVNQDKNVRVLVVTRIDAEFGAFASLKGKKLALPKKARQSSRLFLEQMCQRCGTKEARLFLGEVSEAASAEEALDDLVDGRIDAVLVDSGHFACYQQRKPARAKRLAALVESIAFPNGVLACCADGLDRATITKLQMSLGQLNESAAGRQLLMLWQLSSFETVPSELDGVLKGIAKEFPAPSAYRNARIRR